MMRDRLIAELTASTVYLLVLIEEMLESHADLISDQQTVLQATKVVRQDLNNAVKVCGLIYETDEDDQCTSADKAKALDNILDAATEDAPVEVWYRGKNENCQGLWAIRQRGPLPTLQGTKVQIINALSGKG